MGLVAFVSQNIWHVAPILATGVLALVIILDRFQALVSDYPFQFTEPFFEKIRFMVMGDRIPEAIAFCDQLAHKPVVRVIREALLRAHQPEALLEHGLEIAVADVARKVQARTPLLATLANVATLLGLVGTIIGLIQSFEVLGAAGAQERSAMLTRGVGTAMNATLLGLAVAVPSLVAYGFLTHRANQLLAEVDVVAIRMLDLLKQRLYTVDVAGGEPGPAPSQTRFTRSHRSRTMGGMGGI
jgi:biopolymer transport protein ExbB/TolQ